MHDLKKLKQMQAHIICWVLHHIPAIEQEIRRSITEIHQGNVYIWIDLEDSGAVFTQSNAERIANQWAAACQHFQQNSNLFIQTNN